MLHRSCSQPGWHFYNGPSFPAKNSAGLSDPGSQPSWAVGGSLKPAGPFLEDSEAVLWRERHDQGLCGVSFKKLLLSNLGRSQEDSPWARQPLLPSADRCYSCKDNSVKQNADRRDGVIQRLRPSELGCLSIKQDWGLAERHSRVAHTGFCWEVGVMRYNSSPPPLRTNSPLKSSVNSPFLGCSGSYHLA